MITINAYAIQEKGGLAEPFAYERALGDHDVLVKITHCSIARGDVQFINNDWGDTRFPLVPGHEIIGLVEQAGTKVTSHTTGDRVGIGYQQSACFECAYCRQGLEQFCPQQTVIAVNCFGGLAEHIIVDERFAFGIPQGLDSAKAVPLLSSGLTVFAAISSAVLPPRSTTAVLGVGGLGMLAIRFLVNMGHDVSAFSHSPDKRPGIEAAGVTYINPSQQDTADAYNGHFDFLLSTINAGFDLDKHLRMLKPTGKCCLVASPLQPQPISLGLLYDYSRRTIYGNYTGSRKDMRTMLDFVAAHQMECAVEVLPFDKMNEGIAIVQQGKTSARLVLEREVKREQ